MADYLIIGGHGKVALRTAPLLVEAGHTVTSVIRSQEQVEEIESSGAKALVLDIEEATQNDLSEAMVNKDGVIFSAGAGGGNPQRTWAIDRDAAIRSMDAADQAQAKRYVMVSYMGAELDHGVPEDDSFYPYAQGKAEADDYLSKSDLDWTILGPGVLTLEDPSEKIALGKTDDRDNMDTSRGNVAHAIVAALETPNTIGKKLDFVDGETPIRDAFAQA